MKKIRLAILGLGNVPLAVLRYMEQPGPKKALADAGLEVIVTGVTTGSRGHAISEAGLPLAELEAVGKSGDVASLNKGPETGNNLEFIARVPADILFVATPAKLPSVEEIRAAFAKGMSVVTSNKTPVANNYRQLLEEAKKRGVQFRFGATVLAGFPPWRHFFEAITRPEISEAQIVVNATSNQILTMMLEQGKSFDDGVKAAQDLGIAERDPSDDVDGHDTQKKLAILANSVMGASLTADDIPTSGIRNVTVDQLKRADAAGHWVHLLGRAWRTGNTIQADVKALETDNPFFAHMRGTAMGLYFQTPEASFGIRLDLGSGDRAIMATAAGVFEDILTIAKTF